uniref:Uncharacterized protein n=1 Tax=Arundo donax TaxID=35708 RepID=A0A0A8YBB2_ARUDO
MLCEMKCMEWVSSHCRVSCLCFFHLKSKKPPNAEPRSMMLARTEKRAISLLERPLLKFALAPQIGKSWMELFDETQRPGLKRRSYASVCKDAGISPVS